MNTATAHAPLRDRHPVDALLVVAAIAAAALLALAVDPWWASAYPRELPAAPPVLPTSARALPAAHDITRWTAAVDWSRIDPAGDASPQSVAAYER